METLCINKCLIKASAILLGLAIGLCTAPAFAVHDEEFELDHVLNIGANIVNDGVLNVDWEDLFDANYPGLPTTKPALPANFGPATFLRDFTPGSKGPDTTAYTGGSADVNDISTWSCTRKNNIGNKFNILNAYATAYVDPVSLDTILYFALERRGNEGTASVGFWFLGDGTVACEHPSGGGSTGFTGNHQDGDLLVISDFTGGGKISSIFVYKWEGGAGGSLNPVPVAGGGDCEDALANDTVCATVNRVLINGAGPGTDIPWLTETKQPGPVPSNDLDARLFFEGGLNLTQSDLNSCFATFHATTRSSDSLTSEKHDYTSGSFPLCKVELSKTCSQAGAYDETSGDLVIPYNVSVENTGSTTVSITAHDDNCGFGSPTDIVFNNVAPGQTVSSDDLGLNLVCSISDTETLPNDILNGVSATSATEGVSIILADSCVTDEAFPDVCFAGCGFTLGPNLAVAKNCVTALEVDGSIVKVRVDFSGSVSNTSDTATCKDDDTCVFPAGAACTVDGDCQAAPVPLENVAAEDNKAGALTLLDALGGSALPTPVKLDPGDTAYFEGSYDPDGTGMGFDTCPSDAQFMDTVTGAGDDVFTGESATAMATATCELCPEGGCPAE
ncbi:MAG: hypothetical protein ABFS24_11800 [Pseudomonadota bacterium]